MKNSYRIFKNMLYSLGSKHLHMCDFIVSGPCSEVETKIVKIIYLEGLSTFITHSFKGCRWKGYNRRLIGKSL